MMKNHVTPEKKWILSQLFLTISTQNEIGHTISFSDFRLDLFVMTSISGSINQEICNRDSFTYSVIVVWESFNQFTYYIYYKFKIKQLPAECEGWLVSCSDKHETPSAFSK